MSCANTDCVHSFYDHGEYEYLFDGLVAPMHPKAELTRVSERCLMVIDLGGDEGRRCGCVRFQKPEEEEAEAI